MVEKQYLNEDGFPKIAVHINENLRKHPDIGRGAGIIALMSFVEILRALRTLEGQVTAQSVVTAALTTFPHRIKAKALTTPDLALREVLYRTFTELRIEFDPKALLLPSSSRVELVDLREEARPDLSVSGEDQDGRKYLRISMDDLLRLLEGQEKGEISSPTLFEVLLGLLAKNSDREDVGRWRLARVSPEFLKRLERLGLLCKDRDRLDVYTLRLGSSDQRTIREAKLLLLEQLDELARTGGWYFLEGSFSKEELRGLLFEIDKLLELRSRGGSHEDLASAFLFQRPNFPIINRILEEWVKHRRAGLPSNEWLERAALREELRNLINILKASGQLEEKNGELKLTHVSYRLILEEVLPEIEDIMMFRLKPRLGQGEDEDIVDVRRYRPGDRYRDISTRGTIRRLIRRGRDEPMRSDFMVNEKEPHKPLDIIFAVDSSLSMGSDEKLSSAKKAAVGLSLATVARGDHIGIVAFSDGAEEVVKLTEDVERNIEKIFGLRPLGSTNVEEALHVSGDVFLRSQTLNQKHIILVTDGEPTSYNVKGKENDPEANKYGYYSPAFSRIAALREAKRLRGRGVTISTICITRHDFGEGKFCERLARTGGGRTYIIRSGEGLLLTALQEYNQTWRHLHE